MFSNKLSDNGLKIITDNVVCYSIIYLKKTQAHYPLTSRVSSTGWQRVVRKHKAMNQGAWPLPLSTTSIVSSVTETRKEKPCG